MEAENLRKLHCQLLKDGYNCNNVQSTLVDALGGIDNILSHYLSLSDDQESRLCDDQIAKIHDILSTLKSSEPRYHIDLYLQQTNNFIYSIFDERKAKHIMNLVWNKLTASFMSITLLFVMISFAVLPHNAIFTIIEMLLILILMPYQLFLILSVNCFAFKRIIRSFEFWFKLLYAMRLMISWDLYYYVIIKDRDANTLNICHSVLTGLTIIAPVVFFSLFDGLNIKLSIKIILGILFSTFYSLMAFFWTFNLVDPENDGIINISNDGPFTFPVISMVASSARILAIFFWKQTILSIKKRHKCINIKIAPYVHWDKNRIESNIATQHKQVDSTENLKDDKQMELQKVLTT